MVALILVVVLAPLIAPYEPDETHPFDSQRGPSLRYLLGTDSLGRDVLSRVMFAGRVSLLVAFVSVAAGEVTGFTIGVVAGYLGGKVDLISQRVLEVLMSFPSLILAILLLAAMGFGIHTVIIAIAVTRVPGSVRVARSVVLSVKEMSYVEAARAVGASPVRIMALHVAPQCVAAMLVVSTAALGGAIFSEAALSFLGLGIPPPTASWGNMLGETARVVFNPPWWIVVFPGLAITITVFAFNLLGDALRDYLDPRLRGRLR